jgi:uncharacterized protein YoxC
VVSTADSVVLWVIAVAVIGLSMVIFLLLQQIRQLVGDLRRIAERVEKDLPALTASVTDACQNISRLSENADQRLNDVGQAFEAARGLVTTLSMASSLLRGGVCSATTYVRSAAAGFKAAVDFVVRHRNAK